MPSRPHINERGPYPSLCISVTPDDAPTDPDPLPNPNPTRRPKGPHHCPQSRSGHTNAPEPAWASPLPQTHTGPHHCPKTHTGPHHCPKPTQGRTTAPNPQRAAPLSQTHTGLHRCPKPHPVRTTAPTSSMSLSLKSPMHLSCQSPILFSLP